MLGIRVKKEFYMLFNNKSDRTLSHSPFHYFMLGIPLNNTNVKLRGSVNK